MEYYAGHLKRNRRKRARLPSNPGGSPYPVVGGPAGHTTARPLGSQGWAVRYDFKAALFSEMRGEVENARRCVEDPQSAASG